MDINHRLELLIAKTTQSKATFSAATGISTVILSHISSGRNKVSLSAVEQILVAFPQVNSEWLITGKGSMFKEMKDTKELDSIKEHLKLLQNQMNLNHQSMEKRINEISVMIEDISL